MFRDGLLCTHLRFSYIGDLFLRGARALCSRRRPGQQKAYDTMVHDLLKTRILCVDPEGMWREKRDAL